MKLSYKIACYAYECNGDWSKIAQKIKDNEDVYSYTIEEKYVTIVDSNYPESFRQLRYPPWVIFYEGDITLATRSMVSVVGSRKSTMYGEEMTTLICKQLVKRNVLVSGLAKGIDALVHHVGISQGKTIGVLGCGLGEFYPRCNIELFNEMRKHHLVLSEYPKLTKAQKHHFPWRNRLIAALGDILVVTQAQYKSGTMLTVNEAIELSKEVYCVPYPMNVDAGKGCNLLIQQGAQMITEIDSFLNYEYKLLAR